jgi:hypothetical protein
VKEEQKPSETGQIFSKLHNSFNSKKTDNTEQSITKEDNNTVKNQVKEPLNKKEENQQKQNTGFLNNYSLEKNETSKSLFFNNKPENTDVKQTNQNTLTQSNTNKKVEENKVDFSSSLSTAPQTNLINSISNNNSNSNANVTNTQGKSNSLFNSTNPFTNCSKPAESMFSGSIKTNQSTLY